MTEFTSPVGRYVQGNLTLKPKKDNKGKPVLDAQGVQVMECFIALAVPKNDPNLNAFYQLYLQTAMAAFPSMFDTAGTLLNPNFAMKIQDGDGRDNSGQSVADKPGFAGCYVFKFASRFPPTVYAKDSNGNYQVITNPDELIKKGYYISVSGTLEGNGVVPGGAAKSGLYASPNQVLFVAPGEVIATGGDPNKAFAGINTQPLPAGTAGVVGLPAQGGLPSLPQQGAVQAAQGLPGLNGAGPSLGGPSLGGGAGPALLGLQQQGPALGGLGQMPQGGGLGQMPPQQQGPQYSETAAMQGATIEYATAPPPQGLGWTIEALLAKGMIVKNW